MTITHWCLWHADFLQMANNLPLFQVPYLPRYLCANPWSLRLFMPTSWLSLFSPNPSNAPTYPFYLCLFPGACWEGSGLLSGGSEGSFLLRAVSKAVPQTPGVWQPHKFIRPRTQTGGVRLHCRYTHMLTHTYIHTYTHHLLKEMLIWSHVFESGGVGIIHVVGKLQFVVRWVEFQSRKQWEIDNHLIFYMHTHSSTPSRRFTSYRYTPTAPYIPFKNEQPIPMRTMIHPGLIDQLYHPKW